MRKPSSTLNVLSASAGTFAVSRGSRSLSDCGGSAASSATTLAIIRPVAEMKRVITCRIMADTRGEGNHQSSRRAACLKEVANLGEQLLILRQQWDVCFFLAANPPEPADELDGEEE